MKKDKTSVEICIPTNDGNQLEYIHNITFCEADGNCTWINFQHRKPLLITQGLSAIRKIIDNGNFIRCHKSILANINYIENVSYKEKALFLVNGEKLDVSRRKMKKVKSFLLKNAMIINRN